MNDAVAIVNELRIIGPKDTETDIWLVNKRLQQLLFNHIDTINFQQIFERPIFTLCNSLGQDLDNNLTLSRVI